MKFVTIDVKEIECEGSRANFDSTEIEILSDLILEGGGILQPLILKQSGERYSIIDGYLEYFSAVRAREKDPRRGEMVYAFIINENDEKGIREQLKILRPSNKEAIPAKTMNPESTWISSFETRLSEIREVLFQTNRENDQRFKQLEKNENTSEKMELLDLINTLDLPKFVAELSRYGLAKSKAEAMFEARQLQDNKVFSNYQDIVKATKGLGPGGILNLIDSWNQFNGRN